MKLLRKLLCIALVLCICLSVLPAAFAEETEEPAENTEMTPWDTIVKELVEPYEKNGAVINCGYLNLVTGEEHYYHPDDYLSAASMYKVPLNMVVQEKMASGEIDWEGSYSYMPYEEVLEQSIVYSSNDAAMFLWGDVLGGYDNFRFAAAKYSGETEDDFNDDILNNNLYTPRIIINTLKYLYEHSDEFPTIIKAMQKAEPNRFFKFMEPRYNIAHKYGYYENEYHTRTYVNDCAIAYTDDPIAIVMFTDTVAYPDNPEELLTSYCTLMCGYTQDGVQKRQKDAEAAAAAQETENVEEVTQAPVSLSDLMPETPEGTTVNAVSKVSVPVIPGIIVLGFSLLMLLLLILNRRRYNIGGFWMLLCVIVITATLLVSVTAKGVGTVYARPNGDPRQEISAFMDDICRGDYSAAYSRLKDYSTLGLENQPGSEAGRIIYDTLRSSYDYQLVGNCTIDKLNAVQTVRLKYLDLGSISDDVQTHTMAALESIVQSRAHNEVYDDNSQYLPEVATEAYLTAVGEVMAEPEKYYRSVEFDVNAEYSDGSWKIITAPAMLKALNGGAGY